jgi:hypothetical protein
MNNKQKGMIELVILGVGVVAVLAVGFLLVKTFKNAETKSQKMAQQIDQLASETSTDQVAGAAITSDLQTEINTVSFDDLDASFKEIDADLNSL